jgi:hypothetical protein
MKKLIFFFAFLFTVGAGFSQTGGPVSSMPVWTGSLDSFYVPAIYKLGTTWFNRRIQATALTKNVGAGQLQNDFYNLNFGVPREVLTPSASDGGKVVGLGFDVKYDTKRSLYVMLYTNFDGTETTGGSDVYAATSPDLITWTKIGTTPIFPRNPTAGRFDDGSVTFPQLLYDEAAGVWHMYYIGFPLEGFERGQSKVGHATTSDLLGTWTRDTTPVIAAPSGWMNSTDYVFRAMPVKRGATYYLFFNGGPYGNERFGVATASSPAGPFAVTAEKLIPEGTKPAPWTQDEFFSDPFVFKRGDKWYCAFWGRYPSWNMQMGLMWTTDAEFPKNWRPYDNYISLATAGHHQRPTIVEKDGEDYLFFNGGSLDYMSVWVARQSDFFRESATNYTRYGGTVTIGGDTVRANYLGSSLYLPTTNKLRFGGIDVNNSEGGAGWQTLKFQPTAGNRDFVARFHPSGTNRASVFEMYDTSSNAETGRLIFRNEATRAIIGFSNNFSGDKNLDFTTGSTSVRMRIYRNGNVHIGGNTYFDNGVDVLKLEGSIKATGPGRFSTANFSNVPEHTDNAAALTAGLIVGDIYRTGDLLKIVH